MQSTPQVETTEISDSELDNVSGGLVGEVVSTLANTADQVAPVTGTVAGVEGLVQSTTGLNPGMVTGAVSSL
jgi:bacteriocin-like protein